jgi:hypothetical protein
MNWKESARLLITLAGMGTPVFAASRPTMTIRVLDQANSPRGQLNKMERFVETTLAFIEVDVKWVDCEATPRACLPSRGPNEFWLRILAQSPPREAADKLGFTQSADTGNGIDCINIFYPMVSKVSENEKIDFNVVFGAAVSHEIGHLYLGTNQQAHSPAGLMKGTWSHSEFGLASIGELNFTRAQGARIRTAMMPHAANEQRE